jgi:glycosyltransferase involved in cell wall biosynthesis
MNKRRVSIVINNYNYSEFLEVCIQSALSQTYQNLEIIVVDDGSTDQSRSVLEKYKDRVLVILKEHGGETSGRNAGFERSEGEIVTFLDSDDFLRPDTVERIVAVPSARGQSSRREHRASDASLPAGRRPCGSSAAEHGALHHEPRERKLLCPLVAGADYAGTGI